jgi:uncharacterized protein (TIGR02598 family)
MFACFNSRGFSLVEVTLSVGLLAFVMVALMALLPNGLTSSLDASRQMTAASVASRIMADLRAAASGPSPQVSAIYGVNLTNAVSRFWTDSLGQVQPGKETADFLVEISCGDVPADGNARTGVLRMRWPAADEDPAGGVSFFFAY